MKIFLDLGFYWGLALEQYLERGEIDNTWTVYAFEPNPGKGLFERLNDFPMDVELFKQAVWIEDGATEFWIGGRTDSGCMGGMSKTKPNEVDEIITVPTVDISQFVKKLPEAKIICNMDVEGAEYEILEKMLKDKTIDKIDILDIEFHHRIRDGKTEDDTKKLKAQIEQRGVEVRMKI